MGCEGVKVFIVISLITLILFDLERPNLVEYVGCIFPGVSHASTTTDGALVLPNFGGSHLLMRTSFDAKRPNFTW